MRFLTAACLLIFSASLGAQPPAPTVALERMRSLGYMEGVWRGTGWIEQGGPRQVFAGTETIQKKLNGLALLVEGKFTGRLPGQDQDVVVHETLAVLSYDAKASRYMFRTYLANGGTGDHEVTMIEGGWQWGLQLPNGSIRFTIRVNDGNRWVEIGEASLDGKPWRQFFEMTLQRAPN